MEAVTAQGARRAAVLVLLAAVLVWWLVRCSPTVPVPDGAGSGGASGRVGDVELSGSTSSLMAPGSSAPLNLRLTNSASYAVSVTRFTVSIRAVDAPRSDSGHPCTPHDFIVHQAPRGLVLQVSAGTSSTLLSLGASRNQWPRVAMLDTSRNQDGCKGASVALGYRASARQATR
jgi:hypothetical protein